MPGKKAVAFKLRRWACQPEPGERIPTGRKTEMDRLDKGMDIAPTFRKGKKRRQMTNVSLTEGRRWRLLNRTTGEIKEHPDSVVLLQSLAKDLAHLAESTQDGFEIRLEMS